MGTETLFPPVIPTQGHSNRPTPRLSPLILVQHRRKTRPTRSRTSPCPWPTSLLLSRGSQNSEALQPRYDSRSGLHLPPRAIGEGADGGDNSSWYQQGARWGQKKGGDMDKDLVKKGVGEGPDLLKDCNVDNAMEKCSLE